MGSPLKRELREPAPNELEELEPLEDVPAAVVCALCGEADCPGCANERSRSGIVAIVSWERPGPVMGRLWSTARATTREAEAFFGTLPDGPIVPALRFALLSEMLAATAMIFMWIPVAAVVAPLWLKHVALDGNARSTALRLLVVGIPALATLFVAAHAVHGLALDRGARTVGAAAARRRALRFGLYATGWDLVIGPLGACVVAIKEGLASAGSITQLAIGLPSRSTRAFLRGAYGLDGVLSNKAQRSGTVAAVLATLIVAFVILAALAALLLI